MNCDANGVILFSSIVTAIATAVIAWFTKESYKVYSQLKRLEEKRQVDDEKRQKEVRDLYQAIVISNLPCAGDSVDNKLKDFVRYYEDRHKFFGNVFDSSK